MFDMFMEPSKEMHLRLLTHFVLILNSSTRSEFLDIP